MDIDKELDAVVRRVTASAEVSAAIARAHVAAPTWGEVRDAIDSASESFERVPGLLREFNAAAQSATQKAAEWISALFGPSKPRLIERPTIRDRVRAFLAPVER